jgi:hypothetical protein
MTGSGVVHQNIEVETTVGCPPTARQTDPWPTNSCAMTGVIPERTATATRWVVGDASR